MRHHDVQARLIIREAGHADLPALVRLFSFEEEGIVRNERDASDPCYADALTIISRDPDNAVFVAEMEGAVLGTFQLTIIQQLTNRGGRVAQIESVVVDPAARSRGIGEAMMRWAIDEARRRKCVRVQLTSNKVRKRAHAFYERLGFVATHEGMKLVLAAGP